MRDQTNILTATSKDNNQLVRREIGNIKDIIVTSDQSEKKGNNCIPVIHLDSRQSIRYNQDPQ